MQFTKHAMSGQRIMEIGHLEKEMFRGSAVQQEMDGTVTTEYSQSVGAE